MSKPVFVAMSKPVLLPVGLCALLGACALNAVLVVAQVAEDPASQSLSTTASNPSQPVAPVIDDLRGPQIPAETGNKLEAPAVAKDANPTEEVPPPQLAEIASEYVPSHH